MKISYGDKNGGRHKKSGVKNSRTACIGNLPKEISETPKSARAGKKRKCAICGTEGFSFSDKKRENGTR
jgi:hypothetical protein